MIGNPSIVNPHSQEKHKPLNVVVSGKKKVVNAGATAYSAYPPPTANKVKAATLSPRRNSVTPSPTSSTKPAISLHWLLGGTFGNSEKIFQSLGLLPQYSTLMSTCPKLGLGVGVSSMLTLGPGLTMALFMMVIGVEWVVSEL